MIDSCGRLFAWGANDRGQVGGVMLNTGDEIQRPVGLLALPESSFVETKGLFVAAESNASDGDAVIKFINKSVSNDSMYANLDANGRFVSADRSALDSAPLPSHLHSLCPETFPYPIVLSTAMPYKLQPKIPIRFRSISCGSHFSAAIDSSNNLWTWGANDRGQLGQSDLIDRMVPTLLDACHTTKTKAVAPWLQHLQSSVNSISCGTLHSLALLRDGRIAVWGGADASQLGVNPSSLRWITWNGDLKTSSVLHNIPESAVNNNAAGVTNSKVASSSSLLGGGLRHPPSNAESICCPVPHILSFTLRKIDNNYSVDANEENDGWCVAVNPLFEISDEKKAKQNTSNPQLQEEKSDSSFKLTKVVINTSSEIFFSSIAAGDTHSLAVSLPSPPPAVILPSPNAAAVNPPSSKSFVLAWGTGQFGQLGLGFSGDDYQIGMANALSLRVVPRRIQNNSFEGSEGKLRVFAGGAVSAVLDEVGQLWTWGTNDRGQTGHMQSGVFTRISPSNPTVTSTGLIVRGDGLGVISTCTVSDSVMKANVTGVGGAASFEDGERLEVRTPTQLKFVFVPQSTAHQHPSSSLSPSTLGNRKSLRPSSPVPPPVAGVAPPQQSEFAQSSPRALLFPNTGGASIARDNPTFLPATNATMTRTVAPPTSPQVVALSVSKVSLGHDFGGCVCSEGGAVITWGSAVQGTLGHSHEAPLSNPIAVLNNNNSFQNQNHAEGDFSQTNQSVSGGKSITYHPRAVFASHCSGEGAGIVSDLVVGLDPSKLTSLMCLGEIEPVISCGGCQTIIALNVRTRQEKKKNMAKLHKKK
eukprot:GDKK01055515.1.p1 GENE.GDKK01055515.1~~GDKK01055515.1.p1  ORF type:complete len:812 (+),score=216.94 GDKK01055515.1:2-2437(+)